MTVSRIPTDAAIRLHPCVPVADELAALDAEPDEFEAEFHDLFWSIWAPEWIVGVQDYVTGPAAIAVAVHRLRRRLETAGSLIETRWDLGYLLRRADPS